MREIIYDTALLQQPAEPLKFLQEDGSTNESEGAAIIKQLKQVLQANPQLTALSAPQIGYDRRIFCIRFNDAIKCFINPILTKKQGMKLAIQTTMLFPGKEFVIGRPEEITVVYYNEDFKYEDNKLMGYAAALFDQQYQLLEGVLPDELGLMSDIAQDGSVAQLTEEEFVEIGKLYAQFIQAKHDAAQKYIAEHSEAAKTYKALKFTEDVINGRTQVIYNDVAPKTSAAQTAKNKKAQNKAELRKFLNRKKK